MEQKQGYCAEHGLYLEEGQLLVKYLEDLCKKMQQQCVTRYTFPCQLVWPILGPSYAIPLIFEPLAHEYVFSLFFSGREKVYGCKTMTMHCERWNGMPVAMQWPSEM